MNECQHCHRPIGQDPGNGRWYDDDGSAWCEQRQSDHEPRQS